MRWIRDRGEAIFSRRDMHQGLRAVFNRVAEVKEVLEVLKERGYIRALPQGPQRPGRPSSPQFEVHPDVFAQKPHKTQKSPIGDETQGSVDCVSSVGGVEESNEVVGSEHESQPEERETPPPEEEDSDEEDSDEVRISRAADSR